MIRRLLSGLTMIGRRGDGGKSGANPDGIHHNASGVAAVLTAARILREEVPGYDVVFVFFGAGTDD